jgi:hypothetical protein
MLRKESEFLVEIDFLRHVHSSIIAHSAYIKVRAIKRMAAFPEVLSQAGDGLFRRER